MGPLTSRPRPAFARPPPRLLSPPRTTRPPAPQPCGAERLVLRAGAPPGPAATTGCGQELPTVTRRPPQVPRAL
ncbi:hypothetical protein QJS66_16595 [Kocuria rhizophila]|nr:hypothetical protein QJS66_16595 [Kocuria rhizophila]